GDAQARHAAAACPGGVVRTRNDGSDRLVSDGAYDAGCSAWRVAGSASTGRALLDFVLAGRRPDSGLLECMALGDQGEQGEQGEQAVTEAPPLLLAFALGVILGIVFFGALWWTVARGI